MSFSIPYLFTLYLRLENQTSALVFLKFSGNARTTNLRPLVCLFVCLFFFSDVSSQVTGILCSELSKKKCSWEMSPRNSLGLSRSVKTGCKERKSAKREKKDDDYNCKGFNFRYKILKNMNSSISCHLLAIWTFWVRIQLS